MEKRIVLSIWIIATFLLANYGYGWLKSWDIINPEWPGDVRQILAQVVFQAVPPILLLALLYGRKKIGSELGLRTPILKAITVAGLATLPMLIGYGLAANWQMSMSWRGFFYGCVFAALMEELLYRGFLFGQLFRQAKWGFIPAGLIAALVFGSAHLYQSNDWDSMAGIFFVTAIGSLWFAWLYVEWNYNLWVPIFFHFLMNFYWGLFDMDTTALGGLEANIYRALTIALSIIITIRWNRNQGHKKKIHRGTLFSNNT